MEKYDYFAGLAEKKRLTADEKQAIREAAEQEHIAINAKCSSCYFDAAVQLALLYKPKQETEQGEYELREGIDITLHSAKHGVLRVNKANCTPENARKWIAAGCPRAWFAKLPEE